MNHMVSDLEDKCIQALLEFIQADKGMTVGVLIFDGLMVEKNEALTDQCLEEASAHIQRATGYRVRVIKKPMDEGFALPPDLPEFREHWYASTDDEAVDILLGDLEGRVKLCQGVTYVKEGHLWVKERKAVKHFLVRTAMAADIWRVNNLNVGKPYSKMMRHAEDIVKAVESKFAAAPAVRDDGFVERMWHSTLGCVCFTDKLYDMRKWQEFSYKDRPDVMTTVCVPRPLPKRDEAKMREVRERVLMTTLGDEGKADTYLQVMARATAGEYEDKQPTVMTGERNSGKGVAQTANEHAFGPYVNTTNGDNFLMKRSQQEAARGMSWAMESEFARQTYTNEIQVDPSDSSCKIDGNILKKFQSGGDKLSARKLYVDERTFQVQAKLIMNLNDMPEVVPSDAVQTMIIIKFPFKFVSSLEDGEALPFFKLADNGIKKYLRRDDVIDAFTWLVFDAYRDHPVRPCAVVRADTEAYKEDMGDPLKVFAAKFTAGERGDYILMDELKALAQAHGMTDRKAKDLLAKMMNAVYDRQICVKGKVRGSGMRGIKYACGAPSSLDD
jgi:phage/plasmid-associated DNA primase